MTEEEIKALFRNSDQANELFLFGLGMGEHVRPVLDLYPESKVTVWDRDPWLIRLFLMQFDISDLIRSGRIRFWMCADLLDFPAIPSPLIIEHPFLRAIYRKECQWMHRPRGDRWALLCEGELFVDDIADALWNDGYDVFTLDTTLLSLEEMTIIIRRIEPEFLMVVDYRDKLAEFCYSIGISLLSWEVNPTTDNLSPCSVPTHRVSIFTYRASQVSEFREAGFTRVEYLPLATNPERRKRIPLDDREKERYAADFSFVGSSMADTVETYRDSFLDICAAHRPDDPEFRQDLFKRTEKLLTEQERDYSAYRIPGLFKKYFDDILDEIPLSAPGEDPVKLLAQIAAAIKRLEYIRALGPLHIKVWGDQGWRQLERCGVCYMGPAGHFDELTKIYCGTRINIDIGRLYQQDIVPMRVFDILSCGAFLLAEHSEAIPEIFEIGKEIETYRDVDELMEKALFYRDRPELAMDIARRGARKVRVQHTVVERTRHMIASLGKGAPGGN